MKKIYLVGIIIFLALIGLGINNRINNKIETAGKPTPKTPVELRIGYSITSLNHAPTMVAIEKGIFSKYGLSVKTVALKNGGDVAQALAAGQIDLGAGGVTNFFTPIDNGVPIKFIMPIMAGPSSIRVRKDSGITTLAQLKNARIGVEPNMSSDTLVVLQVLKEENIETKNLNLVPIEKTLRPIALLQKKEIDASVINSSDVNNYDPKLSMELKGWAESIYPKQSYLRGGVVVNTNYLDANPEIITNYVKAITEAQKFLKENPAESARLVTEHMRKVSGSTNTTAEKNEKGFNEIVFMVWDDPQIIQKIADTSFSVGQLKHQLTLDQMYDQRFAPMLKQAQQEIFGNN